MREPSLAEFHKLTTTIPSKTSHQKRTATDSARSAVANYLAVKLPEAGMSEKEYTIGGQSLGPSTGGETRIAGIPMWSPYLTPCWMIPW